MSQPFQLFYDRLFAPSLTGKSKNKNVSATSTLIPTISVTKKHIHKRSLSSNLLFTLTPSSKHIHKRSLSSNLLFTLTPSSKHIYKRSLSSNLLINQSLSLKRKINTNLLTNIPLFQTTIRKISHLRNISSSIILTQNVVPFYNIIVVTGGLYSNKLFPDRLFSKHLFPRFHYIQVKLKDPLSFSQTTIKSLNKNIHQNILLTQSILAKHIINRFLTNNIVFTTNITNHKRFNTYLNQNILFTQSITKKRYITKIITQNIPFTIEAIKEWQRHLNQNIIFIQSTSENISNKPTITQNILFTQNILTKHINKPTITQNILFIEHLNKTKIFNRSLAQNIIFTNNASTNNKRILKSLNQNISFNDSLSLKKIINQHLNHYLLFTQNTNLNNNYSFHIDDLLIFKQTGFNTPKIHIPVEDIIPITDGGIDLKAESKNCFEVSDQCHAEGFETIAGLSFPCIISNGQVAIISNYNNNDFFINCNIGLYNLKGGTVRQTELKTRATTISLLNNNQDTLITFPNAVTDHTEGFISLLTDWAAHSEGYKTIASGKASHAGGIGSISELPTKFAHSDNNESQYSIISLSGTTTNSTLTQLLINGTQFKIRNNRTYTLFIHIGGRNIDGSEHAYFIRQGIIHNENNVLSFVGSIGTIGSDINNPDWTISITADTVLKISVAGENGKTIKWFARIDCLEL